MALINKALNEVTVKLVYYGPGLCGKTTNLEKIYASPKVENKGKLISMSTETDRTLFFDFMPLELGTIAGQKLRVQLYTVPGQVFYDATRKLVLRGADGVVFVADSQESMRESNIESLLNLRDNLRLNRIDPDRIAMVFQYNKRDLPTALPVEEINMYLQPGSSSVVEAVAVQGTGVTATLRAAVSRILENLRQDVDVTLPESAPLEAPDLSAGSGTASGSVPKITVSGVRMDDALRVPTVSSDPAEPSSPANSAKVANAFGSGDYERAPSTPVVTAPTDPTVDDELDTLIASARAVVETLEGALAQALEHERMLVDKRSRR